MLSSSMTRLVAMRALHSTLSSAKLHLISRVMLPLPVEGHAPPPGPEMLVQILLLQMMLLLLLIVLLPLSDLRRRTCRCCRRH